MRTPDKKSRDSRLQEALAICLTIAARLGGSAPSPKNLRHCAGELTKGAVILTTLADDYETIQ